MRVNLPIYYSQFDQRWADILLGFNTSQPYTIANFGCLDTDLAMVCRYYGKDVDPQKINELLKSINGFTQGSGDYIWKKIESVFADIKEIKTDTPDALTDAQLGEIKSALDNGYPVVVQLDYNPQTVLLDSHYVTLIDYNPSDENDFTIADPLGGVNGQPEVHSLKDYLGGFWTSVRKTINQYIIYQGPITVTSDANCLLPNTDSNQKVYTSLVHGSTQWDKTVNAYIPDNDPKVTEFEDVQKVIAAFKGQASNAQTQLQDVSSQLAVANSEIENRKEQVSRLQAQVVEMQSTQKAEIDALKASYPNIDKLKAQYESNLAAKQNEVDEAKREVGTLKNQLAAVTAGIAPVTSLLQKLFGLIFRRA